MTISSVSIPPSIEGGPVEAFRDQFGLRVSTLIPPSIEGGPVEALRPFQNLFILQRHSALN